MTYVKQTWVDGAGGGTPLSADRLNHIEDGIEGADAARTAGDTAPYLVSRFGPGAAEVAVERVSATLYYLYQNLGQQRWWRQDLRRSDTLQNGAAPGGADVHMLDTGMICVPMLSANDNAGAYTGADWLQVANTGAYLGIYTRTPTAGQSVTFTTPANTVRVGLHSMYFVNSGLALVAIDGDTTRATLLPTAQMLVDAGTFPNTILVAGGGTLNPGDRVLDQYSSANVYEEMITFASDLTPAPHTMTMTCTGYKRAASSDIRIALGGFTYSLDTTTLSSADTLMSPLRNIMGVTPGEATALNSAWEFAHNILPSGATTPTFVGNYHGYEKQDSISFAVDGAIQTLADGQRVSGTQIVVTRISHLLHPDTGVTNIAAVTVSYTMDTGGLRIQHTTIWAIQTSIISSYPAMLPGLQSTFDKGSIDTTVPFALTAHAGAFSGKAYGRVVAMWDSRANGKAAVAMYVPDPVTTLANFVSSAPIFMAVQDNNTSPMVKCYGTRVSSGSAAVTAAAGAVWVSDSYRKVAWLPSGADAFFGSL